MALAFYAASADAACTQSGYIERVTVPLSSIPATILLRQTPTTENLRWTATTVDARVINAATIALTSRIRVTISSAATLACPTVGVERPIGNVSTLTLVP